MAEYVKKQFFDISGILAGLNSRMSTAATHYRVCELVTFQQCSVVNKLNLSGTYQGYKLMRTAVLSGALVVS